MTIRQSAWHGISRGMFQKSLLILVFLLCLLLLTPLILTFTALRLPASVLGSAVSTLTSGQVRLAVPSGQVRSGRAEFWVRDSSRQEWLPWMPIEWTLDLIWRDGSLVAVLATNAGRAEVELSNLVLSGVSIALPPGLLLSGINHPLTDAPWRGDIELSSQHFVCDWSANSRGSLRCEGAATMRWRSMGSSILPLPEYGDYLVAISALRQGDGIFRADISTEAGAVEINGFAEGAQKGGRYQLVVRSDRTLIEGLNSVIDPGSRKRGPSGEHILDGEW